MNTQWESLFATKDISLELSNLGFESKARFAFWFQEDGIGEFKLMSQFKTGGYFGVSIEAPLWQQVIDWLADIHGIHIEVKFADKDLTTHEYIVYRSFDEYCSKVVQFLKDGDGRKTYSKKEALRLAIIEAIGMVKTKQEGEN